MSQRALFEGLVSDENGQPVGVAQVGGQAQYVVDDGGFHFHVPAEQVDRDVLKMLREQIMANQDAVTQGAMQMLGKDDLFTKVMIDSSLKNMDEHFTKLIESGLPAGRVRTMPNAAEAPGEEVGPPGAYILAYGRLVDVKGFGHGDDITGNRGHVSS